MQGVILDFSLDSRTGLISCDNGNRYYFALEEWKSSDLPKNKDQVDFQSIGDQAHEVYRTHPSHNSPYAAPNSKPAGQANATAVVSFIASLLGIFGFFFIGSLIGVICGHIARSQIRASQGAQDGDGLALAGLIIGYIGLVFSVVGLFVFLMILGVAASGAF